MVANPTRRDVLLSWALAEAMSPRWANLYEGILEGGFALSPDALSPVEQAMLLHTLQSHRKELIVQYVDPAARFERGVVQPGEIAELLLMPWMTSSKKEPRRVTLGSYAKGKYDPNLARDPRNAARVIYEGSAPPAYFGYPILAWDAGLQAEVIIEGNARLVYALMRHENGYSSSVPVLRCIH